MLALIFVNIEMQGQVISGVFLQGIEFSFNVATSAGRRKTGINLSPNDLTGCVPPRADCQAKKTPHDGGAELHYVWSILSVNFPSCHPD